MTERRLRAMQLAIAAAGFAGVIAELVLHEHWAEPWQVVPFFLCGAGIAAIAAFAARPGGATARVLRVVMLSAAVGAVAGIVQHLQGNMAFEREIFPESPVSELLGDALRGVAPLLAPGGIALGALLAAAATHRHPALENRRRSG
jgi:hypothetical protein